MSPTSLLPKSDDLHQPGLVENIVIMVNITYFRTYHHFDVRLRLEKNSPL
jgi:hypothetical protein